MTGNPKTLLITEANDEQKQDGNNYRVEFIDLDAGYVMDGDAYHTKGEAVSAGMKEAEEELKWEKDSYDVEVDD